MSGDGSSCAAPFVQESAYLPFLHLSLNEHGVLLEFGTLVKKDSCERKLLAECIIVIHLDHTILIASFTIKENK